MIPQVTAAELAGRDPELIVQISGCIDLELFGLIESIFTASSMITRLDKVTHDDHDHIALPRPASPAPPWVGGRSVGAAGAQGLPLGVFPAVEGVVH